MFPRRLSYVHGRYRNANLPNTKTRRRLFGGFNGGLCQRDRVCRAFGYARVAPRLVNDNDPLVARLEADAPLDPGAFVTYQPGYFQLTRQSETNSGSTPEIEITVDNAVKLLMPYIDAAKESRDPIQVTWRPYLANDLTAPHISPPLTLSLRSIEVNMTRIIARAGFGNTTNRRFPALEYLSTQHPGLAAR
jgi:Domain of unknown function (DUF1833)